MSTPNQRNPDASVSETKTSHFIEPSDHTLDTEFIYYCALLQDLIPQLQNLDEQEHANRWLTKLVEPSLKVRNLRDKRNRFLMMLCISLFSGHIQSPFNAAPTSKLPEVSTLRKPTFSVPDWHVSGSEWKEHLLLLSDLYKKLKLPAIRKCSVHTKQCTGGKDARANFLDRQFEFFLYLTRSYLHSLNSYPELRVACKWIEALSQIDRNSCTRAKGIRNDHLLVLMSYLLQHQLMGPFCNLPSHPLEPLMESARKAADNKPMHSGGVNGLDIADDNFLSQFPVPDEGAFAFISLSSDLIQKAGQLTNS